MTFATIATEAPCLEKIPLDSAILDWVRYLPDLCLLQIGLRTGAEYQYSDVPHTTYLDLLAADSKGRYFNYHIRNDFPCQQIKIRAAG